MNGCRSLSRLLAFGSLFAWALCLFSGEAAAGVVTFSGTVTYSGSHAADTLYVAVIDTNTTGEVQFVALGAYPVGAPPFSQPFSVDFDNAGLPGDLIVAAALDVDGGGIATLGSGDVVGWYNGGTGPALVSPAQSRSDLDFALPRAEIHGNITFSAAQTEAWVKAKPGGCSAESFRPETRFTSGGAYAIVGLYPGTYCVQGDGTRYSEGDMRVCHGDPTCAAATLVVLSEGQVVTGVNLDFSQLATLEMSTWGAMKELYK